MGYIPKVWETFDEANPTNPNAIITPADLNRWEQYVRAATPELLWTGQISNAAASTSARTARFTEPVTNFEFIEFVCAMYGSNSFISYVARVASTFPTSGASITINNGFAQSGAVGLNSYLHGINLQLPDDGLSAVLDRNGLLSMFGGTAAFTVTLNLTGYFLRHVRGINRIAG